jgi:hypothetical protein
MLMRSQFYVSVCMPFQLLNKVTDFHEIQYELYAIQGSTWYAPLFLGMLS